MVNKVGNWVAENCSTSGTGDLIVTGAYNGLATFAGAVPAGAVWYSIEDGNNREAGLGTFDGVATIVRTTVHATFVSGVYNSSSPSAITLTGNAIVSCTFNSATYDNLLNLVTAAASSAWVKFTGKTAAYTILTTDRTVLCDATAGAFTLTLPPAADAYDSVTGLGQVLVITKTDPSVNIVTVDGDGTETVAGSVTQALTGEQDTLSIISDGSNWHLYG